MIPEIANILVYDTRRNLTLTVVTKNVPGKSSEWAALMRHNFYTDENTPLPNVPFFLLALANKGRNIFCLSKKYLPYQ